MIIGMAITNVLTMGMDLEVEGTAMITETGVASMIVVVEQQAMTVDKVDQQIVMRVVVTEMVMLQLVMEVQLHAPAELPGPQEMIIALLLVVALLHPDPVLLRQQIDMTVVEVVVAMTVHVVLTAVHPLRAVVQHLQEDQEVEMWTGEKLQFLLVKTDTLELQQHLAEMAVVVNIVHGVQVVDEEQMMELRVVVRDSIQVPLVLAHKVAVGAVVAVEVVEIVALAQHLRVVAGTAGSREAVAVDNHYQLLLHCCKLLQQLPHSWPQLLTS